MKRRVLITGGYGYLGGAIAAAFAERKDFEIIATSRSPSPPYTPPIGVEHLRLDLLSPHKNLVASLQGVSSIIHLAAPNDVSSALDPAGALVGTAETTCRLIAAAEEAGVARLVYFSTAQVYGAALQGTVDESTLPRPRNAYGIAHRCAEDFVLAAQARGKLSGLVLRLSNAVGAPQSASVDCWRLLANDLCRQALERQSLTLKGDGQAWRSFIAMADVIAATHHCLLLSHEKAGDGLFNLGGNASWQVLTLAKAVAALAPGVLGHSLTISRAKAGAAPPPLDYRSDRLAMTGFTANMDLESALRETLVFCQRTFAPQ